VVRSTSYLVRGAVQLERAVAKIPHAREDVDRDEPISAVAQAICRILGVTLPLLADQIDGRLVHGCSSVEVGSR
jgi:hypothetical protein